MGCRLVRLASYLLEAVVAVSLCSIGYGISGLGRITGIAFTAGGVVGVALAGGGYALVHRRLAREQTAVEYLTRLPSRSRLLLDLERGLASANGDHSLLLILFDLVGFKEYNDAFGRPAGDALLRRLAVKLSHVVAARGRAYRLDGDEFAVLVPCEEEAGNLADLAAAALVEEGDGFAIAPCYGTALIPDEGRTASEALRVANERMYALKYSLRPASNPGQASSNEVLMDALARRGPDRGDHVHGLTEIAEAVARKLKVGFEELEQVKLAAELHDVGKTALPTTLLQKSLPLDQDEREFVERHPLVGERLLHSAPALHRVARLIRSTHERFDGEGYPDHLSGSEIPLGARIINVCDAFDAMISSRPYRKGRSVTEAVDELRRNAGTQFDPAVVEAFCEVMEERERFFLAA
jgi:two-component system cell cycle response regulator